MEYYTEKRNVFQDQRELSVEDQLAGKEHTNHFKAILDNLGIYQTDSPHEETGLSSFLISFKIVW
jgi:hypothetical protein